jgi:hypothetical protein
MSCKSCGFESLNKFGGEIALHFRGLDDLNKPIAWVFSAVFVCLNCGAAEFIVPENQLSILAKGGLQDDIAVV